MYSLLTLNPYVQYLRYDPIVYLVFLYFFNNFFAQHFCILDKFPSSKSPPSLVSHSELVCDTQSCLSPRIITRTANRTCPFSYTPTEDTYFISNTPRGPTTVGEQKVSPKKQISLLMTPFMNHEEAPLCRKLVY